MLTRQAGIVILCAYLLLVALASYVPIHALWGINHLAYLSWPWHVGFWGAAVIALLLLLSEMLSQTIIRAAKAAGSVLFENGHLALPATFALFGALSWFNQVPTRLLGDSLLVLSHFSGETNPALRWTEAGSIWLVRHVQLYFGHPTESTALLAFRHVSAGAGVVWVGASWYVSRFSSEESVMRLVIFLYLICSALIVLFLGYVEHYAAACSLGLVCVAAWLAPATSTSRTICFVSFAAASLLHVGSSLLFPLPLSLVGSWRPFLQWMNRHSTVAFAGTVIAGVSAVLAIREMTDTIQFDLFIRPLLASPGEGGVRAIISLAHISGLINLCMLLFGLLPVLLLSHHAEKAVSNKPKLDALVFCAALSLVSWIAFHANLGMYSDWDLLSLLGLPLIVGVVLWFIQVKRESAPLVISFILVLCVSSVCYIGVTCNSRSSVKRFNELVANDPFASRTNWNVLQQEVLRMGDTASAIIARKRMQASYPDHDSIPIAYAELRFRRTELAERIGTRILASNRFDASALQLLGNSAEKRNDLPRAIELYRKSIALRPYDVRLRNEFAQMQFRQLRYEDARTQLLEALKLDRTFTPAIETLGLIALRTNHINEACRWADSLFVLDHHSPGGYLLRLSICLQQNNMDCAWENLSAFTQHGRMRPDYKELLEYYENFIRP